MASYDFRQTAQEATLLCKLMQDKEKLETEDVLGKELTIVAFDFAPKFDKEGNRVADPETGELDTFGVVTFAELPNNYYCVGTIFTKVCKAWAAAFAGSPEAASSELSKQGGVKVRFEASKTKKGNNLTSVKIL